MKIYRQIAKGTVLSLLLVLGMGIQQAQENKPPETKRSGGERSGGREQRDQREHTAAPREQHTAPAQQNAGQPARREAAPADAQRAPVSNQPTNRPAQVREHQQTPAETHRTTPVYRESQPGAGGQPHRNTGEQPARQPAAQPAHNPRHSQGARLEIIRGAAMRSLGADRPKWARGRRRRLPES